MAQRTDTGLGGGIPDIPGTAGQSPASRRTFMTAVLAAGVTLPVAEGLWRAAKAAEPQRGGTLRLGIGHGSTSDTLDPATIVNAFQSTVGYGATRNTLTVIGTDGSLENDLAESYDHSPDAKRWSFQLRAGLEFHNGKSVTPRDVIESINHHRGPNSKSAVKSLLTVVDDIQANGPRGIVFQLKDGNADFPYYLSDWHLPIGPAKPEGGVEWSGVGTGPFVLDSWEPGVKATMRRFNNYHHAGRPYFDAAEAYSIPDVTARTSALISGSVDFIDRADPKTFERLSRMSAITTLSVTGGAHYTAPMDCTAAPFNDVNVRNAVKYAIDREEIVRKILGGQGLPGNDNPVSAGMPFRTQPLPIHAYDPDKARFHLKQAGLSNVKLTMTTADAVFVGAVDTAVLMQASAAKAGIDIDVVRAPNDGYWSQTWMKKPWCMGYWNGRSTCDWLFSQVYASGSPWNESSWKNERFDALLAAARPELDPAKRAEQYAEMQQLIHDDSGQIVLMFNNFLSAHSKRLQHGPKVASNLDEDGFRIYERWWFA